MAQLQVDRLTVQYGAYVAVSGVSLEVQEGEFVSLLGPSGCGKTTTLRCIAGLESASAGRITIGGQVVADGSWEVPPNKRGVNMVFQSYAVWPHMTVFDNVAYGLRSQRVARGEIVKRVRETLALVGLAAFEARYGTELSGGQQQRLALARAVVTQPRLLLFDEPLSNLDAGLRERMRGELMDLQRRVGRTSVYVTHDQAEAMAMSDRVVLMRDGRIVQQGTPRDLYERPNCRFAAEFVGNANLLPGVMDDSNCIRVGQLQLRSGVLATNGPNVLVCIRPENLELADEEQGENVFAARVERVAYLGNSLSCEIAAGELRIRADLPARTRVQEGAALHFRVSPANVTTIPETDTFQ